MSEIEPELDVTEDKATEIAPQEAIGLVQVYPVIVIFWEDPRSIGYGVVTVEVVKKGLEHGGNTTGKSTMKSNLLPPSISTSYVA